MKIFVLKKKRIAMMFTFMVALFIIASSMAFAIDDNVADVAPNKDALETQNTDVLDPFNNRLAIQVDSNGRFNIGAFPNPVTGGSQSGSWNLTYRWPGAPGTSFTTFRIDGADNIYGSSGARIQAPTDIDARTNTSIWKMGDIEVTQTLQLVLNNQTNQEDIAKIAYTVKNTGAVSHAVGGRVMLDTDLNYNDGAPFRVPGDGIIRTEKEYIGSAVPDTFTVYYNITDSIHVAAATLRSSEATHPDRIVLAYWPYIFNTSYDYTIHPGVYFTSDSAYAVYWYPQTLASGESRTYVTYYGLAQLTADLRPPLALGISAPATLSVVNNAYSPNPFTVTATVLNNGTASAQNVAVTIHIPAGLSLVSSGTETKSLGVLSVGQERQVTWEVRAENQSSEKIVTYSIDATADNTDTKTLSKQITLPAVHSEKFVYVALGDSYQSGEGAGNSISNTADYLKAYENLPNYPENTYTNVAVPDGNSCHRSLANYAKINRDKLKPNIPDEDIVLIDVTCSGATAISEPGNIPQRTIVGLQGSDSYDPSSQVAIAIGKLQSLGLSANDVDLVTVGMGGNDAQFTNIIAASLFPNIARQILEIYPNPPSEIGWLANNLVTADRIDNYIFHTNDALSNLPSKETWAQNVLLNVFDHAHIMQLNYPDILPMESVQGWCSGIGSSEFNYVHGKLSQIDTTVGNSVQSTNNPRLELVNIRDAFGGNALCQNALANGFSEAAFNAETSRLLNAPALRSELDKLVSDYGAWKSCVAHFGYHCDTEEIWERMKTESQNIVNYLNDNQNTIFANLAVQPIQGAEDENIRFDRSRGLFHPNAKGFAVIACYVRAAFNHQSANGCFSATSPLPDLVNGDPIRNAPISGAPGESIHVQMSGFAQNASVRVTFASVLIELETVTSDSNGVVDTIITLPEAGAGAHTIEFRGNTPDGVGIHKRVRVNYTGRPNGSDTYAVYFCGFTPFSENSESEQIDINYFGMTLETITPDEDGCVFAEVPVFDVLDQSGAREITARSQITGKTVTTTIDPIPSVIGLWADSNDSHALSLTGSEMNVAGLVHSNADITVRGSKNTFVNGVEYVTALTIQGSKNTLLSPRKVASGGLPTTWNIADYRPGGSQAIHAGTSYHIIPVSMCIGGVWDVLAKDIPSGIVYTPCSVQISGSKSIINATIVAEGSIKLSGSNIIIGRGIPGIPAVLTNATGKDAFRVEGSGVQIRGTIQALGGQARITGAKGTYRCGIIAQDIEISGAKNSVVVDDQCIVQ